MSCDRIDDDWMDCDVCPDFEVCQKEEKYEWVKSSSKDSEGSP